MSGPRLLAIISGVVFAMCVLIVVSVDPGQAAAATAVRWTARTSLVLFAGAYVARPLVQLWPHPFSKWLLKYRKWLGLGFAASHLAHLEGLIALAAANPDAFWAARGAGNLVGVTTYVALALMTITSSERIKRQMAPRTWKRLHLTGLHLAWFTFTAANVRGLRESAGYLVPVLLLLGIAGARAAAFVKHHRSVGARAVQ